ncbi:MAG: 3',5'-cyclic-nucleotide phosphodiesterase [Rhodocyclaceae bacterium]|nr:3',5'-cyclic-nucleotide phosphodiesterase [Rhodocyclaceae bacterium]
MKIRILGCSGGIGGRHLRTTSMLVDHDVLIDCGTGVADLSIAELAQIDHVFLTHSHMDHIACLPLMIDTVGDMRNRPLLVHALPETIEILRAHLFNWAIWPDFAAIPTPNDPWLRFAPIAVGQPVELGRRRIVPLPACHTVPAVAYQLDSGRASLVFSGDTGPCRPFWQAVNAIDNLSALIIETAFSNRERRLAETSQHLCPSLLVEELRFLQSRPELFITHLKPGQIELTMEEIENDIGEFRPRMLQNNQVFEL